MPSCPKLFVSAAAVLPLRLIESETREALMECYCLSLSERCTEGLAHAV